MTPEPGDELVDLIDEDDRVIGRAARREVRARNLLHRAVGVLCRNPRGELYVHRRTPTKDVHPSLYDMWVGGVVAAGEGYAEAAGREVAEELGVESGELAYLFQHRFRGARTNTHVALFELVWDGPIRHQPEEIVWGRWMSLADLEHLLEQAEFVPGGLEIWHRYRAWREGGSVPG